MGLTTSFFQPVTPTPHGQSCYVAGRVDQLRRAMALLTRVTACQ